MIGAVMLPGFAGSMNCEDPLGPYWSLTLVLRTLVATPLLRMIGVSNPEPYG